MKKISIYVLGILAGASLVACDDYKEPNPPAQNNPAPLVLKADDVTVTNMATEATYDLNAWKEEGKEITLAYVSCEKLQEGYDIEGNAFISVDDFENSYEVPVTVKKDSDVWVVSVDPQTLSTVYQEDIDWSNDQVTLDVRYQLMTVYANQGGDQVAYIGGKDYYYGPYSITIIPVEINLHFDYLYTPGNSNDWTQTASQLLKTDNFSTYYGFAYLDGGFKFTSADNWDGFNFGAGEEEGTLSTDPEAGNLEAEKGLYWCDVNVDELTYTLTQIEAVSMIGDFNDWGGDVEMTPSDDFLTWTGTLTLEAEGGWKFRMNNDWTINLGGSEEELTLNGGNITSQPGTYTVTLNLGKLPYSCTVVAQ